jgi:hypothetical protein
MPWQIEASHLAMKIWTKRVSTLGATMCQQLCEVIGRDELQPTVEPQLTQCEAP